VIGPGAGVRGRNSPACAESHSIAERVTRLRGCVCTQVIQPGGETAKVRGGARGPLGRGREVMGDSSLILPGGVVDFLPNLRGIFAFLTRGKKINNQLLSFEEA